MYNNWLTIGRFTIHGYGVMIAVGILVGLALADKIAKKNELDPNIVDNMVYTALITGWAGSKLTYVLVNWNKFLNNPMAYLGPAGWVVWGGIIFGILGGYLYARYKKISFLDYFNVIVIGVALAQAFGRIGCFFAGCCYGRVTTSALSVVFPEGSLAPAGVHLIPTQLMSALGDFLICAILYRIYENKSLRKFNGFYYIMLYSGGRFFLEFFRGDAERGSIGMLSTSQFISICAAVVTLILLVVLTVRQKKQMAVEEAVTAEETPEEEHEEEKTAETVDEVNEAEETESSESEEHTKAEEAAEESKEGE